MHISKRELENTDRIKRLNIVNSISGIKPANLIGTVSSDGSSNLAIFSSVFHLGSDPALIAMIARPQKNVKKNTFSNILENKYYTINHIHRSFIEKAHYTSAKFKAGESEFERCNLTEHYLFDFKAPFVLESNLKLGMKFIECVPIKMNGTTMIIGEIEHIVLPDEAIDEQGQVDLTKTGIGISGLNSYYELKKVAEFSYARIDDLPSFD